MAPPRRRVSREGRVTCGPAKAEWPAGPSLGQTPQSEELFPLQLGGLVCRAEGSRAPKRCDRHA